MREVDRMIDYIDANLGNVITLKQLADAAGYSPWHASRLFSREIGVTPFAYIRDKRLNMAAQELAEGGNRVLDVALDFVFSSQEGFTRAFTRRFGIPPGEYARRTHKYTKQPIKEGVFMETTKSVFVQPVVRPARKVILKRGEKATEYFEYCDEVGCEVWDVLCDVKGALYEPAGMWLPESLRPKGTSEYIQGVELPIDWQGDVPESFELAEFPECMMLVFQGEPYEDDEQYPEAIGELWRHIDRFDPKIYGYRWAPESGPRIQLAPMGYRGYIEARPVEKL